MIADATIGFAWRGHLVPGTIDQFIQYSSSPGALSSGPSSIAHKSDLSFDCITRYAQPDQRSA